MNTYEANAVIVMPHEHYVYNFVQSNFPSSVACCSWRKCTNFALHLKIKHETSNLIPSRITL